MGSYIIFAGILFLLQYSNKFYNIVVLPLPMPPIIAALFPIKEAILFKFIKNNKIKNIFFLFEIFKELNL
jgi:hypothetical protein